MIDIFSGVELHREDIGEFLLVESLRMRQGECAPSFVDIEGGLLGQLGENGFVSRKIAPMLAFAEPVSDHSFLIGAGGQLGFLKNPTDIEWSPQLLPMNQRFNDTAVDLLGRLVVGTLSLDSEPSSPENQLFVLEKDGTLNSIRQGVGLSNGIAVDPLSGDLFHVDTLGSTIHRIPLDKVSRGYGDPELIHRFEPDENPDGLILLESGELLVALWGQASLVTISPDRGEMQRIGVSPRFPTSVCICNRCGQLWMGSASQPRGLTADSPAPGALWKSFTKMRQVPAYSWIPMGLHDVKLGDNR